MLNRTVVAVLEIMPPSSPDSTVPAREPKTLYATYPPRLIPTTSTTISQTLRGFSTSNGP